MRHGDSEAHQLVFVVDGKSHKVFVEHRHVLLHIAVYLLFRQFGVFVQRGERFVEHMEHLPAALGHLAEGISRVDMHAVALLHKVSILKHGRKLRGQVYHSLGPVHVFGEAQALQILPVVWIIIYDRKGAFVFKSFDKQALAVHVGKAQGALYLFGALSLAPFYNLINQSFGHFEIFYEIYPPKAHRMLVPLLVGIVVYDSCNTSQNFAAGRNCQVQLALAEGQRRIVRTERLKFVIFKSRDPFITIFVKVYRELNELPKHFFALNGHDFNRFSIFHLCNFQTAAGPPPGAFSHILQPLEGDPTQFSTIRLTKILKKMYFCTT